MTYKIAVGSSDGSNVDLKFGEVGEFLIYEVSEGKTAFIETRKVGKLASVTKGEKGRTCETSACDSQGCSGNGQGCSGPLDIEDKISLISDCRCVVCKKVGFQAQKQFEKKAISVFDVACKVEDALEKITFYYGKMDKHESFALQNRQL